MKHFFTMLLTFIFIFITVLSAFADKTDEKLDDIRRDSQSIDSKINSVTKDKNRIENKIDKLEEKIDSLTKEEQQQQQKYERMVGDIGLLNETYEEYNEELKLAQEKYDRKVNLLKTRLRVLHESSVSSVLDVLLQSRSFVDFFQKLELMMSIAKRDKELIEELKLLKKDMEFKRNIMQDEKNDMSQNAKEQNSRIEDTKIALSDRGKELRAEVSDLKQYENLLQQLYKESNRLTSEIIKLQSQIKYSGGEMAWPLPSNHKLGTRLFGMQYHPILKKLRMHNGIDITGKYGASIVAANNGTVIRAGWSGGYGYTAIIDHGGGISTLYAHCSKLLVKKGNKVEKGQQIAKVGDTGLARGAHLHFEVRENGVPVDPLKNYLKR